ncbi:MAG: DUF4838 domain-containing protein [Lentisphaeria bacterium]|nr:DUF4838 domain-containing protein [Lentisphaeria bacterium]
MKAKSILLLGMVLGCAGLLHGLDLVKDGKANARIVVSDKASLSEKFAAKELSKYAGKITGTALPVAKEGKALPIRFLIVPEGTKSNKKLDDALKKVKYDGFVILAEKESVLIAGRRGRSLLYAVYHIIKENGVIFFHPDPADEGEYVPVKKSFAVKDGLTVKSPVFNSRKITLNGGSLKNQHVYNWFLRNGIQVFSNRPVGDVKVMELDPVFTRGGHNMGNNLVGRVEKGENFNAKRAALLKEHPEYFGLVKGKRVIAGNDRGACQPCTSNPETLKRMLENIRKEIAIFGGKENIYSFCNDDHTQWCECENCSKLDDPTAPRANRHAKRWWHFVNYMAKNILAKDKPLQSVHTLVYQTYRFPPKGIKPDPRVPVVICPHQRCYIHPLNDPACPPNASTFKKMFDEWAAIGQKATTFEYHTQMPGATRYLPMERAWVEDLRYYHKLGMEGFGFITRAALSDFGKKRNTPFNLHMWMSLWQQHYLTAHFSWNIHDDVEKVLENINSKYYGKAWKYMKPYRAELTKALYAPQIHMGYGTPDAALGQCMESAGLTQRLHKFLDDAEKAVAKEPLYLKRVQRDRLFLKLSWEDSHKIYKMQKQKEYVAKKASGIVLDGKLDEKAWKTAEISSDFRKYYKYEEVAELQTFVRILFDKNNIYFGIECLKAKSGKVKDAAVKDGIPAAMKGSHLEIFLTPKKLNGKYQHLGFTHNGKKFDALTTSGSSRDESIKTDFQFKITEEADRWVAEVKVPLKNLKLTIGEGETWKVNVGRVALLDNGKSEASAWAGAAFHGSDVHRTVAFGEKGAMIKNGDFEDLVAPRRKLSSGKPNKWKFVSAKVPKYWNFNENNFGSVEIRNDKPFSGKNYMRIIGKNSFVGQFGTWPKDTKVISVTMKVRGKGEILTRVFGKKKEGFLSKINSPDKWTEIKGTITLPELAKAMWLRITGTLDIDDVQVAPSADADEDMPTAEKHS